MTVNKYRFNIQPGDRYFNIPVEIKTDLLGRDDLIEKFEEETIEKVINPIEDFEVTRYAHKKNDNKEDTYINYQFNFFDRSIDVESTNASNQNLWVSDYVFTDNPNFTGTCFNEAEIYYNANSYKKSFFKLDLYDTTDSETQQIYLTLIIPTQQGKTRISSTTPFTESSGPIQGPTLPDVMPSGPAGARSTGLSVTLKKSVEVYNETMSKLTLSNELKNNEDAKKFNIKNLSYNEQLKFEMEESKKRAFETISEEKNIKIDSTTDFGDPGGPGGPLVDFSEEGEGVTPIAPDPGAEGGDVNPNPSGIGSGGTPSLTIAPPNVQIKLPDFLLDYIGDKEGFYIYWLKNPNYIDLDKLYMGAKFFNAKTGQFIRFINKSQATFSNKFNFDKSKNFYYEVSLDINNYEYIIKDVETGLRIGQGTPIKWYEYVNPS